MFTKDFEFVIKVQAVSKVDLDDEVLQNTIKYELDKCFDDFIIYVENDEGDAEVELSAPGHFMKIKSKRI